MMLFGEELVKHFLDIADKHNRELTGLVGRPLYACTAVIGGAGERFACGRVAAMSPFVEFPQASFCWRCREHRDVSFQEEEVPTRMLNVHPLVRSKTGQTPMRAGSIDVWAHAPPKVRL